MSFIVIMILIVPVVSAGFFESIFNEITGMVTGSEPESKTPVGPEEETPVGPEEETPVGPEEETPVG
ncbi:hypothetical protein KY366_00345, partial [Candidatus Woesearchaeota archaeon]|nr:hypothetical protein [Candidatus Woesearchaeota archaeon]